MASNAKKYTSKLFSLSMTNNQYTTSFTASDIFESGFSVLAILVETVATDGAGATLAIQKNGASILTAATLSVTTTTSAYRAFLFGSATFNPSDTLTVISAGANSQNKITLTVGVPLGTAIAVTVG
jgi:hypothetical protein